MNEIERKWILKTIPDFVDRSTGMTYERHFLFISPEIEIRIQRKGESFEFERKNETSTLIREVQKFEITEAEFNTLKPNALQSLTRTSFVVKQGEHLISIKQYHEIYEGLIRAEIEFDSEEQAEKFTPPEWFGTEITDSVLGKDKKLVTLDRETFLYILHDLTK